MKEVTRYFILTDKGRNAGYTIDSIISEVDHIVCASEYDYYGQVHLYANYYFKGNCLVGVFISGNESTIDNFVKFRLERGYLKEVKQ